MDRSCAAYSFPRISFSSKALRDSGLTSDSIRFSASLDVSLVAGRLASPCSWSCPAAENFPRRNASSSTKKREKTDIRAIPCAHGYSVMGPVRQPLVRASLAGVNNFRKLVYVLDR